MTFPGDVPDPTAPQPPARLDISFGSINAAAGEATAAQDAAAATPEPAAAADPAAVVAPASAPLPSAAEPSATGPSTSTAESPAAASNPPTPELRSDEPEAAPAAALPAVQTTPVAPPEATNEPQLAAIIEIPAQDSAAASEGSDDGEGGEWELLLTQVRDWLNSLKLQQTLQSLRRPLSLLGWLLALIVVLRVYSAVISTLDRLPLLPGLLELVGVIVTIRFAATNLVRSQQRQALLQQWNARWKAFRG